MTNTNLATTTQFHSLPDKIARYLVLTSILFLAISPPINNFYNAAAFFILLGGQLSRKFELITAAKSTWFALAFIALYTIGVFYNPYGVSPTLPIYGHQTHYFLTLLLVPLFIEQDMRQRAIQMLILGAIITGIIFTLQLHTNIILIKFAPIPYSIYIAFTCFVLLNQIIDNANHRFIKGVIFLSLFLLLFFLNKERSGMLVFLSLLILMCWQQLSGKYTLLGVLSVIGFTATLYYTSPAMHHRVNEGVQEAISYQETPHTTSSIGKRLALIHYGYELFKQSPWFGKGSGLYNVGMKGDAIADPTLENGRSNPENTYLRIALEIGVVGLALFLLWIIAMWRETFYFPRTEKLLAQGLLITFIVSNFCVTAFSINLSATFFFLMLAVLFGARFDKQATIKQQEVKEETSTPLFPTKASTS